MSGTYAYDGLIYQTNATLFVALEKLVDNNRLDSVHLEIRKPNSYDRRKNDFTVDAIIKYISPLGIKSADVIEVKAGHVSVKEIDSIIYNLEECANSLTSDPSKELKITKYLIVRDESTKKDIIKAQRGLDVLFLEDKIEKSSSMFSTLEEKCMDTINEILRPFGIPKMTARSPHTILLSLKHLFEHEIKRLAQQMRRGQLENKSEVATISLRRFLDQDESFVDVLINQKLQGMSRHQVFEYICNILNGGSNDETPPLEISEIKLLP